MMMLIETTQGSSVSSSSTGSGGEDNLQDRGNGSHSRSDSTSGSSTSSFSEPDVNDEESKQSENEFDFMIKETKEVPMHLTIVSELEEAVGELEELVMLKERDLQRLSIQFEVEIGNYDQVNLVFSEIDRLIGDIKLQVTESYEANKALQVELDDSEKASRATTPFGHLEMDNEAKKKVKRRFSCPRRQESEFSLSNLKDQENTIMQMTEKVCLSSNVV